MVRPEVPGERRRGVPIHEQVSSYRVVVGVDRLEAERKRIGEAQRRHDRRDARRHRVGHGQLRVLGGSDLGGQVPVDPLEVRRGDIGGGLPGRVEDQPGQARLGDVRREGDVGEVVVPGDAPPRGGEGGDGGQSRQRRPGHIVRGLEGVAPVPDRGDEGEVLDRFVGAAVERQGRRGDRRVVGDGRRVELEEPFDAVVVPTEQDLTA